MQLGPLVCLVFVAVLLHFLAEPPVQLVGCGVAGLAASAWLDRISPGHRSKRMGPPRPLWLVWIAAVVVAALLTWPLLGCASLGIVSAVFLAGLIVVSARNGYGLTV